VPGGEGDFCCAGCSAVYDIIGQLELEGAARDERIAQLLEGVFPGGEEREQRKQSLEQESTFSGLIDGMVCPACAWLIHNRLSLCKGVGEVNINFIAETCDITYDPMQVGEEHLMSLVERLGYRFYRGDQTQDRTDYFRFGAGWFFALNTMMLSFVVYSSERWEVPFTMQLVCMILLILFGSLVPFYAAWKTLRIGWKQISMRAFGMESLVMLSTLSAWLYSVVAVCSGAFDRLYFDVVTLLLMLIETGNLITTSFYRRLHHRVTSLVWTLPKKVRVSQDQFRAVEQLEVGERFEVMRGELVPLDGIVLERSEFDFSLITGESVGIWMEPGHFVGAGAKLLSEGASLRIPPGGKTNLLERMVESTLDAFNTKRAQRTLGDRISRYFVPVVVVLAVASWLYQWSIGSPQEGFLRLLSVLIVSCPCAFGIAEPLVLTAAIERLRRIGIQCFNGSVLSLKPHRIIFDKTGTLTRGVPEIASIHWCIPEDKRWLNHLASLESGIEHPVARACVQLGEAQPVQEREIRRNVVSGLMAGEFYQAGNAAIYPAEPVPAEMREDTLVFFGDQDRCFLIVGLRDPLREESVEVVRAVQAVSLSCSIFSGDRQEVVNRVAAEIGISDGRGVMSAEEKQAGMEVLQQSGESVLMVGDGINDAQALAAADLSLAVYSGQIPAKMSADGVFLKPGLEALSGFVSMLALVRKKIVLNYAWAFLYNLVGVALACMGWLSPKYCAVGMVFSNVVVVYNSLFGMNIRESSVKKT
jgi:heavy metal translocating P-type ATPase